MISVKISPFLAFYAGFWFKKLCGLRINCIRREKTQMNRLSVIMANKKSEALKGSGFFLSESEKRKKGSVWMLQSGHFLLLILVAFLIW